MRILGFDPGVKNFAYAVYDTDSESVVGFGWVPGVEVNENDIDFINTVLDIVHTVNPSMIGIERFAFRDRASVESEPINHMIGKLDLLCRIHGHKPVLIMPAHWKVKLNVRNLARGSRDIFPDQIFEAVHQADAAGIAKYVYEKHRDQEEKSKSSAKRTKRGTRQKAQ